mmetsp:Transcript_11443/g.23006  ORF Transcript_11443/g.23006 Transcript_11443/m.23006 type:complete len:401 (+) Transcript_11443:830-2032(+)
MIIGRNLLKSLGAIISFRKDEIICINAKRCKVKMIKVSEWAQLSEITALDFLNGGIPLPDEFQRMFPGKDLREIAEVLEGIPPDRDIKPVRLPFKEGHEDMIVNTPPRARPSLDWDRIEAQVKDWLAHGKVEKSSSPFNTPHVIAPKPYKFPLRKIDELIEELALKKYKSGIDQDQAYTQIPVDKRDRGKLAFSTRNGKYHFCCLPYGLVISGDLYCQRKHTVLTHDGADVLLWLYIWTYVDDDSVGTDTVICHIFILCVIFDRFLIFGFTIRIAKCKWLVLELKYGGHMVGYRCIKPNRSFLQQVAWMLRRCEPEYVELASRISSAFRKPNDRRPFKEVWTKDLSEVFHYLKTLCKKELLNVSFDPKCRETYLYFDWSKHAIGGVLVQREEIVRVWGRT